MIRTGSATNGGGSGLRSTFLNNWTPWIHSNLLAASLLLDTQSQDIVSVAARMVGALDRYLDTVPGDGGCDEGITYWWRAGGSLFEGLEMLASACGDDFGVFEIQKIRAIARYPVIAHIAGEWHVNFADGPPKPSTAAPHVLYRFGRRIGDQEVTWPGPIPPRPGSAPGTGPCAWTAAAQVTAESSSPMRAIQTMVPNEPWCA